METNTKTAKTLKKQIVNTGASIPDHTIVRYDFLGFSYVAIYIAKTDTWYTSGAVKPTTFSHSEFIDVLSASRNVYLATDWEPISAEPVENDVSDDNGEEEQYTDYASGILDVLLALLLRDSGM